jgi:hypothetical protein
VAVSGTPTAHSLDLTSFRVASNIALDGNSASVSAGLSAPSLSFIGAPDQVTLGSGAATIEYALQPSSGIETIANFQYGLDQLHIDLMGAAGYLLQVHDTSYNSQSAISIYSSADSTHGIVLTGVTSGMTAADLLTNHTTFSGGYAIIM